MIKQTKEAPAMLHDLQGFGRYELGRLEMVEHQREGARQRMGRLARALGRRDIPTHRDASPNVVRFPRIRRVADHPGPAAA